MDTHADVTLTDEPVYDMYAFVCTCGFLWLRNAVLQARGSDHHRRKTRWAATDFWSRGWHWSGTIGKNVLRERRNNGRWVNKLSNAYICYVDFSPFSRNFDVPRSQISVWGLEDIQTTSKWRDPFIHKMIKSPSHYRGNVQEPVIDCTCVLLDLLYFRISSYPTTQKPICCEQSTANESIKNHSVSEKSRPVQPHGKHPKKRCLQSFGTFPRNEKAGTYSFSYIPMTGIFNCFFYMKKSVTTVNPSPCETLTNSWPVESMCRESGKRRTSN